MACVWPVYGLCGPLRPCLTRHPCLSTRWQLATHMFHELSVELAEQIVARSAEMKNSMIKLSEQGGKASLTKENKTRLIAPRAEGTSTELATRFAPHGIRADEQLLVSCPAQVLLIEQNSKELLRSGVCPLTSPPLLPLLPLLPPPPPLLHRRRRCYHRRRRRYRCYHRRRRCYHRRRRCDRARHPHAHLVCCARHREPRDGRARRALPL